MESLHFKAWLFGFLGFVLAVTGVVWYEIRKTEMLPTNPTTSRNASADPVEESFRQLGIQLELEKYRAAFIAGAIVCWFLSWRNSVAYTARRYYETLFDILLVMRFQLNKSSASPPPDAPPPPRATPPPTQPYRSWDSLKAFKQKR